MANLSDPNDILAQAAAAAEAAARVLPSLEAEYERMAAELNKKGEQIEAVRTLAERHKPSSNVAVSKVWIPMAPSIQIRTAVPDLEAAMTALGGASVPEMLAWIEENTSRKWGESTVYAQLKKGKEAGRYVNENNKWRLTASVEDIA